MEIENKLVFETINNAVNLELRKVFGPPDKCEDQRLMAKVAVALLQCSFLYFAMTGAPKEVIRDFIDKLLTEEEEKKGKAEIKRDGNRLILPGQEKLVSALAQRDRK